MKKIFLLVIVILALLSSNSLGRSAAGSPFGSFATARTLGMGMGNFGLGFGIADLTSVTLTFNYGLSAHTDGRIKMALIDDDKIDTQIGIGADFKYQLISVEGINNGPFDMALGGFGEYYNLDVFSVFLIGGQFIGSYPFKMNNNKILTLYGRFNLRMESLSYDIPLPNGDNSESNLEFGLNAGVKWDLTNSVDMYGEFQFDGNDGIFIGIDFNVL
ncbi:MAG: hypothetical protein ACE5D6_03045 [Candidatus Zixiibacteriota bacterium]